MTEVAGVTLMLVFALSHVFVSLSTPLLTIRCIMSLCFFPLFLLLEIVTVVYVEEWVGSIVVCECRCFLWLKSSPSGVLQST